MTKSPTSIKLSDATRRLIERAALKRGVNLSEFIREAAVEQAVRTMEICRSCGQPHPAKVA